MTRSPVPGTLRLLDRGTIFDAVAAPANARSCAFTSVVRLRDGRLVVAFRNATGRDTPDGRLRVMGSGDGGRSWQTLHEGLTVTVDGGVGDLYSGHFTEIARGRLLGAFLWVDRSDPTRSFVNPATAGILPTRVLLAESADGGASWAEFREVDLAPHVGCAVTGPVQAVAGGPLALPYESWKEYDDPSPGLHAANLRLSPDGGRTWAKVATVAHDPTGRLFFWDQRLATHPETGELVAMFWTHDRAAQQDLDIHVAWGRPDGCGWSPPVPTGLPGQHCQPIALGGDRLAAVYVHRRDPPGLRAVLSDDFGRTWRRETEVVFYGSAVGTEPGMGAPRPFAAFWQDMMAWRFGHPRGVLLPDGTLFVAFYAGGEAATSMLWVRIGMENAGLGPGPDGSGMVGRATRGARG